MVSQKVVTPVKTGVQIICNSLKILDSDARPGRDPESAGMTGKKDSDFSRDRQHFPPGRLSKPLFFHFLQSGDSASSSQAEAHLGGGPGGEVKTFFQTPFLI